jgi:zinc protease
VKKTKKMRPSIEWIRRLVLSGLFVCCFSVPTIEARVSERVSETVLPNGLKIILLENHKAPVVTFQVWYRVGSRNEEWGRTGLSHMLEHMMFKGTKNIGPEEFSKIIQEHGGNDNAFTASDFTAYFETLSADQVGIALELEADRMRNLVLREQDFRTERMVVMEERRLRTEDNPTAYLMEQLEATAFQTSPYHWPTIGWMEDLAHLTLDDTKKHYQTYYNPANAFIVAVGDFKAKEFLLEIERAFGSIPKGERPNQARDVDPPQAGERRIVIKKEAQLPFVAMAYHVPNLREPDSYVLEVISALLSDGKSSRFYQDLVRDQRLVLNADADHSLLSRDASLFTLSAAVLPGKEAAEVEKALDREIERLQSEPVTDRELEKVKNQLEAEFIMGQDSLFNQAMLLARYEIALGWRNIDDYLPSIRKVSPGDIRRVADRYLIPNNRTVGILVPLPLKERKRVAPGGSAEERLIR